MRFVNELKDEAEDKDAGGMVLLGTDTDKKKADERERGK